ncbi:BCCT family transporter [Henriciella aquimarina]|uniref:BCCT family transporter n=1 Tax=Henriciella aquimarina TaxID=545261 RepID=UPI000A028CA7|nr:BCCT family transporter [Henriciella aquimarina]
MNDTTDSSVDVPQDTGEPGERTGISGILLVSLGLIALVTVVFSQLDNSGPEALERTRLSLTNATGWFTIFVMNAMLGVVIYLGVGPHRKLRIGGPEARPDYSLFGWIGMLFAAGTGIGLLFYSVSEPISHFETMRPYFGHDGDAARRAMNMTILHWGLHGWAIYALVALILAWFHYNREGNLDFAAPLGGASARGWRKWMGRSLNVFAILGTVFGVVTSLGLGAAQASEGLAILTGLTPGLWLQLAIIICVCIIATISALSGVGRGVQSISKLNLLVAIALMIFVLVMGNTIFVLKAFGQHIGYYLNNLLEVSTWRETYTGTTWQLNWTLFYWAWWIAWSPFVGLFIARISRGRTVGEFVVMVLLVPSAFNALWMTVFGSNALHEILFEDKVLLNATGPDGLYQFLALFPFAPFLIGVATIVVLLFFVTSADSGALVAATLSSGKTSPPAWQKVLWMMTVLLVTALLIGGNGLHAIQTATIVAGFPFTVLLPYLAHRLLSSMRSSGG